MHTTDNDRQQLNDLMNGWIHRDLGKVRISRSFLPKLTR